MNVTISFEKSLPSDQVLALYQANQWNAASKPGKLILLGQILNSILNIGKATTKKKVVCQA